MVSRRPTKRIHSCALVLLWLLALLCSVGCGDDGQVVSGFDEDDPFRIGSITKTFTATAILQLVEEGKLSRSDSLSEWYPSFPNAEKITVEHLLRMQSGIADPAETPNSTAPPKR